MSYYDALIAKWATLSGATQAQSAIDAAKAAYAVAAPTRPTAEQQTADPMAYATWLAALNAWHQSWAGIFVDATVTAKLAQINALTVAGPNADVQVSTVLGYLALQGVLLPIMSYASNPPSGVPAGAVAAAHTMSVLLGTPDLRTFGMSNATVYAGVKANLDALVAASIISQQNEDDLLAMAATTVPWWQSAAYASPIGTGDLEAIFVASGNALV